MLGLNLASARYNQALQGAMKPEMDRQERSGPGRLGYGGLVLRARLMAAMISLNAS